MTIELYNAIDEQHLRILVRPDLHCAFLFGLQTMSSCLELEKVVVDYPTTAGIAGLVASMEKHEPFLIFKMSRYQFN